MAREIVRDPVYKQVTDALVELIESDFRAGDRFLTERQISERFGVSRTTANKALSNLVIEGVLEFRTGVGTFVRAPRPNVNLRRLVSFTEKARAAGLKPATRLLRCRTTTISGLRSLPPGEVGPALGLEPTDEVYEIERLRSLNDEPVIYERRALRSDRCPNLNEYELAGSFYTLLHERYGLTLESVSQRIRARNLTIEAAERLGVEAGTAALELVGVGHLQRGVPLWYEETLYRGDVYEFVNQLRATGDEHQAALEPFGGRAGEDARTGEKEYAP